MTELFGRINRLRDPERPRFVRFEPHDKVHVLDGYEAVEYPGSLGAVLAHEVALCGARGLAGAMSVVPDASPGLCLGCWMLWPHDSDELFELSVSHEGVHSMS